MADQITTQALKEVRDLDHLNQMLSPFSMRAGWNKHEPSLWNVPRTEFRPEAWSWEKAKAALDSAGRLINTEQAERRNLFMVNPKEDNYYATLRTLVCAYQMILPGERARSHRHSPNALRLVLEVGEQCYTVVDGTRIDMSPGDVVLTPGWSWHGHANDGGSSGYWIDYLDVPLVQLLEPMFMEPWPEGFQTPGQNDLEGGFVFPWTKTERRLDEAEVDAHGRARVALGEPALPTIALYMDKIDAGGGTTPIRTTASQIVTAIAGSGRTTIDDKEIQWSRGDVIAIPSWHEFVHQADQSSVLFTVTDEPVLEKLGFLRTE